MNTTTENVYLSVDQLAVRLGVSKDSIWRWRRQGDFPKPVKFGRNTTRWRLADIQAYENERICEFSIGLRFAPEGLTFH